jgi:methyl-accepting chemotaxis protein
VHIVVVCSLNELINNGSMDIEQGAIELHELVDQFKVK